MKREARGKKIERNARKIKGEKKEANEDERGKKK